MRQKLNINLYHLLILAIISSFSLLSAGINRAALASDKYGILGQKAPELNLDTWIDGNGNKKPGTTPETMINYRSGGTPWTVIIDPEGTIVYNDFHIEVKQAITMVQQLIKKNK